MASDQSGIHRVRTTVYTLQVITVVCDLFKVTHSQRAMCHLINPGMAANGQFSFCDHKMTP